jgi:hypothetical protein
LPKNEVNRRSFAEAKGGKKVKKDGTCDGAFVVDCLRYKEEGSQV